MNKTEYMRDYRNKNRKKIRDYNRTYNQIWRKKYGYYNEINSKKRYPEKEYARKVTMLAVRTGKLVRLPCKVCGNKISQAHHEDYTKPLEIIWFCSLHHREHHMKLDKKPKIINK